MSNPFENLGKSEPAPVEQWETVEGRFGCYSEGCGRVTGEAQYSEPTEELRFVCPRGHETSMRYKL